MRGPARRPRLRQSLLLALQFPFQFLDALLVGARLGRQPFPRIRDAGANYASYASQRDRALFFSALLHRAERVGAIDGTPFTTDGLETIDATAVDTSVPGLGLGHGYFADQRSLLTDIGILVGAGLPAAQRGLAQSDRPRYWHFPR